MMANDRFFTPATNVTKEATSSSKPLTREALSSKLKGINPSQPSTIKAGKTKSVAEKAQLVADIVSKPGTVVIATALKMQASLTVSNRVLCEPNQNHDSKQGHQVAQVSNRLPAANIAHFSDTSTHIEYSSFINESATLRRVSIDLNCPFTKKSIEILRDSLKRNGIRIQDIKTYHHLSILTRRLEKIEKRNALLLGNAWFALHHNGIQSERYKTAWAKILLSEKNGGYLNRNNDRSSRVSKTVAQLTELDPYKIVDKSASNSSYFATSRRRL